MRRGDGSARGAVGAGAVVLVLLAGVCLGRTDEPQAPPPAVQSVQLDLEGEWRTQLKELTARIANRGRQPAEAETLRRDALILPADRDPVDVVLRRTEALLADVQRLGPTRDLTDAEAELHRLRELADVLPPMVVKAPSRPDPKQPPKPAVIELPKLRGGLDSFGGSGSKSVLDLLKDKPAKGEPKPGPSPPAAPKPAPKPTPGATPREQLFADVCRIRRQIALANPLLDFDKLLLLKVSFRRPGHCCDQFFGPKVGSSGEAGGIYVLRDPFGPAPTLRNVLADSVVENGRLKGRRLSGGSFLSPDLSYDGREVLFAYTQCEGAGNPLQTEFSEIGIWDPNGAYHIFRVNVDGTGLRQLTDGGFNDFDPCWLPNGRIVFVSERRGGYGRCHPRPVPTYTLHSMDRDGSDIIPLSYHETNEWNPSVNNDGLIVYTRWDYVDRGDCIAHHPWVTTPDGRDARAIQGNYPVARKARPDTEHDVRAIPGSRRYVATAAPHHGQSFGSLILIDPDIEDDGAMGPLKRITPDNGFPETQGGQRYYGTSWPLSEDYYLCVYNGQRSNHAVVLVDSFGNHVLVYADPSIGCLAPLPLRPRRRPSLVTGLATPELPAPRPPRSIDPAANAAGEAVVACVNVYDGLLPWPKGASIKALRNIQLVPKATYRIDDPAVSKWSESLCRGVLGTVPVEPDGSAHFRVPAGKTVYFQALDANGLAVQSMESATYMQPGERLVCQGCHEHRWQAPKAPASVPLALRRAPSKIVPEVEEAFPVAFPRLVQPVLDRKCVPCHTKNAKAPDLSGTFDADANAKNLGRTWTRSYHTLVGRAFGLSGKPPSREQVRTTPGEFGATASKLYQMLRAGHHDLKLTPADLRRITLWLDCNSNFYGAYHDLENQLRGEEVLPTIE